MLRMEPLDLLIIMSICNFIGFVMGYLYARMQ
jgi:uncharacterized membrane protein YpjA